MDGDLCCGTADAICDCGSEARGIVCDAVQGLWREPKGGVQVACALRGCGACRAARSFAGAAASSACDCGWYCRTLPCGATEASDLGTAEGACLAGAQCSRKGVACGEHDRRVV